MKKSFFVLSKDSEGFLDNSLYSRPECVKMLISYKEKSRSVGNSVDGRNIASTQEP